MAKVGRMSCLGLFLLAGCLTGCATAPPPQTVDHVDLGKFSGKWYEIARIPHLYEYNGVANTQVYLPQVNGEMKVIARCHNDLTIGRLRQDVGTATVADPATNAKLRVHMGFLGGDYWVLALDPDYKYAMIGKPDRTSIWILSRTPSLPGDVDEKLFKLADDQGYDVGRIRRTPQPMGM